MKLLVNLSAKLQVVLQILTIATVASLPIVIKLRTITKVQGFKQAPDTSFNLATFIDSEVDGLFYELQGELEDMQGSFKSSVASGDTVRSLVDEPAWKFFSFFGGDLLLLRFFSVVELTVLRFSSGFSFGIQCSTRS